MRYLLVTLIWQHVLLPLLAPPLVRWLRRECFLTADKLMVDVSPWMYGETQRSTENRIRASAMHPDDPPAQPTEWATSPLGILNGVLAPTRLVLVALQDEHGKHLHSPYLEIRQRWW